MGQITQIFINKNRGWRGLAEVDAFNDTKELQLKQIFSFSQAVWDDLVHLGRLVMQDTDYYYVLRIDVDDRMKLPVGHQRSVLIKNYTARVQSVNRYEKATWRSADADDWNSIVNFMKNNNNHTTSDWNCIGIRVIPEI